MAPNNSLVRRLVLLISVFGLAACQPALIYGERTSFNVAAVQLNDNVGEPVRINFGFFRSVATVAPPRDGGDKSSCQGPKDDGMPGSQAGCMKGGETTVAGGDAVSVFSNFNLKQTDQTPSTGTLPLTDLRIRSRFASGKAAVNIAGSPETVRSILSVRGTVGADTRELSAKKLGLVVCLSKIQDKSTLNTIAREMQLSPNVDDPGGTRVQIIEGIGRLDPLALKGLQQFEALASCR